MKQMGFLRHLYAVVTLGILCGYYYLIALLVPILAICALRGSLLSIAALSAFVLASVMPIKFKSWNGLLHGWTFEVWKEYFEFEGDWSELSKYYKADQRYLFLDFPHAIFPLGQLLSASLINDLTPGKSIIGTAADAVFRFAGLRQWLAWIGLVPATRHHIERVFKQGSHVMIMPGGIAEMYLVSEDTEGIYLRKRLSTIRLAIQQGANIVPVFFFGNSRTFKVLGDGKQQQQQQQRSPDNGAQSWLSRFSRRLRMSIIFFHGRWGLPVPFRHPIKMVMGKVVEIQQKDQPSNEEVQATMDRLIQSLTTLYEQKRPAWETRPLVIV